MPEPTDKTPRYTPTLEQLTTDTEQLVSEFESLASSMKVLMGDDIEAVDVLHLNELRADIRTVERLTAEFKRKGDLFLKLLGEAHSSGNISEEQFSAKVATANGWSTRLRESLSSLSEVRRLLDTLPDN